jgi:hypothetical protein
MDGAGNGRKPFHGFILVFYERHETSNHERAFQSGHPLLYVLYFTYINICILLKRDSLAKLNKSFLVSIKASPTLLRRQDGAEDIEFAANCSPGPT